MRVGSRCRVVQVAYKVRVGSMCRVGRVVQVAYEVRVGSRCRVGRVAYEVRVGSMCKVGRVLHVLRELGSLNRAISLGVERTLFSVESTGLYFWRMRTRFLVECLLRILNRRVAVAKTSSKQVIRLVHGNYAH